MALSSIAMADPPPCEVTTAQELKDALTCIAFDCAHKSCDVCPGGCPSHLIVPEGAVIEIGTEDIRVIDIGSYHSNAENPLHLTINGTIKWVDGPNCQQCGYKLIQINGASHLLIDGTGRFTSDLVPCAGSCANAALPIAIRIISDSHDIIIRGSEDGLRFDYLGYAIETAAGSPYNLEFDNLHAEEMSEYGIYCGTGDGVYVHDCVIGDPANSSVVGTYNRHGFRFYADDLTVLTSQAYNTASSACWPVSGEGIVVNGFTTNGYVGLGPNPSYDDGTAGEHVHHAELRDVIVTGEGSPQFIRVELGVWRGCIVNCTTPDLTVGRSPNATQYPPRPLSRIHWQGGMLDSVTVVANNSHQCMGPDIWEVTCPGDVDRNDSVNIDDLLAVINNYGACPAPPVLPSYLGQSCADSALEPSLTGSTCPADIAPSPCGDNTVNIDDLLLVINGWGACGGLFGPGGGVPEWLQDCVDSCEGDDECLIKCIEDHESSED